MPPLRFVLFTCINYVVAAESEEAAGGEGEKKKRQTRGGKGRGVIKTKAKKEVERKICLSRSSRGKKKFVTIVTGLATYGEQTAYGS